MNKESFADLASKIAVLGVSVCLLLPVNSFAAGTVTVMDEAHLRAALAGGGLVNFATDGTITLTNTLTISTTTTIDGIGHLVTLDGSNAVRVITVTNPITLSLVNLTISHGLALGTNGAAAGIAGGPGQGGGIYMTGGTLMISNCVFVANTVRGGDGGFGGVSGPVANGGLASGGAIDMSSGTLLATNCQFYGNSATGGNGNLGIGFQLGNGGNGVGGAVHAATNNSLIVSCVFQTNQVHGGGELNSNPGTGTMGGAWGGAIALEGGTLTNINCQFNSNSGSSPSVGGVMSDVNGAASRGGAIYNGGGSLTVTAGNFAANNVFGGLTSPSNPPKGGNGQGGGIYNQGQMTVSSSAFTFNTSVGGPGGGGPGEGQGGAIYNGGPASVSQSLFTSNAVQGAYGVEQTGTWLTGPSDGKGGAIYNTNSIGIVGCTFAGNEALGLDAIFEITPSPTSRGWGGAIFNSGTCNLTNDTLTANLAQGGTQAMTNYQQYPSGADAYGGGLYNSTGTVFSENNTFALNDARAGTGLPNGTSYGGGIYSTNGGVTLVNTILTNGSSSSNLFGILTDGGHNLSSDASCNFTAPGSLNNTDPLLAPLDNYGGPTPTMALLAGSPAIDGGGSPFPSTDQRGRARPFGSAPDIGAFESSSPYSIHGTVSGHTLQGEITVSGVKIPSLITTMTTNGNYGLFNLSAGTWTVKPVDPNYLSVPTNRMITVGPDQVGVNFTVYRWNELSLDDATNGTMHVVLAGTNGLTYRLLSSGNLIQWTPVATNVIGPTNYWELFLPINNVRSQFYRTVTP